MAVILQVNFTPAPDQPAPEPEAAVRRAREIAALKGLQWKVWLRTEETGTRGGIYLFDDRASAAAWEAELSRTLAANGATNIQIRHFDINAAQSEITRAPIKVAALA